MADETTLRLRIEADTTGLTTGLRTTESQLGTFANQTKQVEQELQRTAAAADNATRQISQMGDSTHISFGKLQAGMVGATIAGNALFEAFDGLTRAIAAPIAELLDAEQAAAMLQGTFGGLTTEMQGVAELATQLGATNAFFDDDALKQAAATLKLFGANGQAIRELLPYVANLATAFGVDVADAAQLVGQALNGQTRGLARMVPEVRGANSQLEVLAALQASAARNAQIADQRINGLGGQFGLLKRQAADAAQAIGDRIQPVLMGVLRFINENMLPGIGKLVAAFSGLNAFFSNLGKGFNPSDLLRLAGEAILKTEEQFSAIKVKATSAAGSLTGQVGNLRATEGFGGGGGGGAAARAARTAAGAAGEMLGPPVPFSQKLETYTLDPTAVKEREAWERLKDSWSQERERSAKAAVQAADEIAGIQDEFFGKFVASNKTIADAFGNTLVSILEGNGAAALRAALSGAGKYLTDGLQAAIPDLRRELGDTAAAVVTATAPAAIGIVSKMVELAATQIVLPLINNLTGKDEAARAEAAAKINLTNAQTDAAVQLRIAADQQAAVNQQFQATLAAQQQQYRTQQAQALRVEQLKGPTAGLIEDLRQRVIPMGGTLGGQAALGDAISRLGTMSAENLGKTAQLAKDALTGTGASAAAAKAQLAALGIDLSTAGGKEIALTLAENLDKILAGNLEPGTIAAGTTPDRPVYVFDVRPREGFGFAPTSFFFRNRGAGTGRAIAGPAVVTAAQASPVRPPASKAGRLG